MTRDEAVEAGARVLDPLACDDVLWRKMSAGRHGSRALRQAAARIAAAEVLAAVGWRPESEVKAEALRDAADGIQALQALRPGEVKASVVWLRASADAALLRDRADALDGAE